MKNKLILIVSYFSVLALTNYHTLEASITQVYCLTVLQVRSPVRVLPRKGCISFWRLRGRICFLGHSSCWQNSVLVTVGLKSPFPCWLLSVGHFYLLEAICMLWLMASFLHFQRQQTQSSLYHTMNLLSFSLTQPSLLRPYGIRLHPPNIIQEDLPISRSVP